MPWRERTPPPRDTNRCLRKPLLFLIVVFLVLVIIAAVVVALNAPLWKGPADVQSTPISIETVSYLLENGDFLSDPCDDFYQYACGNYIQNATIPPYQGFISTTGDVKNIVNERIRSILESFPDDSEPGCFVKAKYYYNSCMNDTENLESEADNQETSPLRKLISEVGGWPVVIGPFWDEDKAYDWQRSNIIYHQMGFSWQYLFRCDAENNVKDLKSYILTVSLPSRFGFEIKYLLEGRENAAVKAYLNLMVKSAEYFGATESNAKREMAQILDFEIRLANLSYQELVKKHLRTEYSEYTISELQSVLPQVDWKFYIQRLLPQNVRSMVNKVQVENADIVFKLLQIISGTDKRIVANYLVWRAVLFGMSYSKYRLNSIQDNFYKELGIVYSKPRWQKCVLETLDNFNVAVSAMYVRNYISPDSKQKISEMAKIIQKNFLEHLDGITWMDQDSQEEAKKRVSQVEMDLLYPEEFYQDPTLDSVYEPLNVNYRDYFQNSLEVKKFESSVHFNLLAHRDDSAIKWLHYGDTYDVRATMRTSANTMLITAGFLQGVYFNSARPDAVNFGSLGTVLGHELFHTIDKKASDFRSDSTRNNWWTPKTTELFDEISNCYKNQFNQYIVKPVNKKVNGSRTLGENLADQAGVIIAYEAFKEWLPQHPKILPSNLQFDEKQLFWLSYANMYCSKNSPRYLLREVAAEIHSPDEFRVLGPISNMAAFAKDFHCKEISFMNPSNKCPAII